MCDRIPHKEDAIVVKLSPTATKMKGGNCDYCSESSILDVGGCVYVCANHQRMLYEQLSKIMLGMGKSIG